MGGAGVQELAPACFSAAVMKDLRTQRADLQSVRAELAELRMQLAEVRRADAEAAMSTQVAAESGRQPGQADELMEELADLGRWRAEVARHILPGSELVNLLGTRFCKTHVRPCAAEL